MSTYLDNTKAVSSMVSPLPSWISFVLRKIACPPNLVIPTSKETRVLVLDFSKIIPKVFPSRSSIGSPFFDFFLSLIPRSMISSRSFLTSNIEMRSRFIEGGMQFPSLNISLW